MPTHPGDWWSWITSGVKGSLRVKLTLMFVLVALVPMITIAVISIRRASDTITEQALRVALTENETAVAEVEIYLAQFPADLLTFANSPPIQGMIRAVDNGGIDPISNDLFEVWANKLSAIFSNAELHKQVYYQLRYLDEYGNEIVRVDFESGQTKILTGTDQLQNKSSRPYFTDSKSLAKGNVLVSELNLNQEHGEFEVPYIPVLRYGTPVFGPLGKFRGIVVSNVYARTLLDLLDQSDTRSTYLATEDLSMAVHPDPASLWGGDLGTGVKFDTEFSVEYAMLHGDSQELLSRSIVNKNDERGEIVALGTIHFDPTNPERYWIVGSTTPISTVLEGVNDLGNIVITAVAVVGLAVAVLAFWLASDFANRIGAVGDAISRISLGNVKTQIFFRSTDEIGKLADSYRDMADYLGELTDAASRIADGDLTVELEPASEDDALGHAFSTMIARLHESMAHRDAVLELEIENRDLVRLNDSRSEFLSSVSHELRTPLTSLLAFGDILSKNRGDTMTHRQLEQLNLMRSNGWKLNELIDDLLDVSRAEAGTFKIEKQDFELTSILQEVTASVDSIFEQKQQNLSVVVGVEPVWIHGDKRRITQVINNLLTNASKYSHDQDEIEVRISDAVGGIEISVSDNGIGIEKTNIARLFTPFFRVNNEQTRKEGGTGLGLVIAKTITALHGGDISVESTLGVGTTMRVFLPTISSKPLAVEGPVNGQHPTPAEAAP